jgi:hypothetical protein
MFVLITLSSKFTPRRGAVATVLAQNIHKMKGLELT